MSEDIASLYGRAVYEVEVWTRRRDQLLIELQGEASSNAAKEWQSRSNAKAQCDPSPSRKYRSPVPDSVRMQFRYGGKYYGVVAHLERELGVSREAVRRVIQGKGTSRHVITALAAAMKRIDDDPTSAPSYKGDRLPALSAAERKLFIQRGACFGGMSRVAKQFGVSASYVSRVACGDIPSNPIIRELREYIAERQAVRP